MDKKMFVIYDCKAEIYTEPFYYGTNAEARRVFLHSGIDDTTKMGAHAADFTLFEIGSYNLETATITTLDAKNCLGNLLEMQEQ